MNTYIKKLLKPANYIIYLLYTKFYIPYKVRKIRKKDFIRVVFILTEVGVWKTEKLYLKMLNHPRFQPQLLVIPSLEDQYAYNEMKVFLDKKKYTYTTLNENETIQKRLKPDIIFYQKPYSKVISRKYRYYYNLQSLFCFVNYGIHSVLEKHILNQPMLNFAWQVYYENTTCSKEASSLMNNGGHNCVVTGLPIMDELIEASKISIKKDIVKQKKTIIWAPHHTIPIKKNWLNYSTFLDYADFMIEVAQKYQDKIEFVFKPHPLLEPKLRKFWGEKKTQAYYEKWRNMPNTRVELGKYIDLFQESDAMIHDCSSFIIEYQYFNKPVMFLQNGEDHSYNMCSMAKEAYNLHIFGYNKEDIINFIENNVLEGKDYLKSKREAFIKDNLFPPNGLSATDNIIRSILGS